MTSRLGPDRPFPGLRPYAEADHEWFFGRTRQTLALYRLLDLARLVAVVGGSGSGKSSVVRAGLLPLLAKETTGEGGRRWRCSELRPGDAPIARLADALAGGPAADEQAGRLRAARRERLDFVLRRSSFGLIDALRDLDLAPGTTPLVLVDQFEELFRFADLPGSEAARAGRREEAAAFVQLLLEATRTSEWPIRLVLTMRSDFIGDCARFHGLPEAVTGSQFLVPSLTRDQREEAIRGPVRKAGGSIADDLVERLLNDSAEELDQLPVLQHVLSRTWHHAQTAKRRDLVLDDYRAVGGIADAVSHHANSVLREPAMRDRPLVVEQVFRALTELDRQGRGIRRPLTFDQLVAETGLPEADLRTVVDRFRQDDCSFLVPPLTDDGAPLAAKDVVDIGHEALIRRWRRMSREEAGARVGWLWDESADGRTYRGLLANVDGAARPSAATLPFGQLRRRLEWWRSRPRTTAWAERYDGRLEDVQRLFATSRRRSLLTWTGIAAIGLAFVVGAGVVLHSWRQAEARANETRAALIWSRLDFEGTEDPRSEASVRALWDLATGNAAVRDAFLQQLAQDRYQVATLASGPASILRAFGLRPEPTAVQRLLGPVLDAIRQTTDPDQLQALAQAVQTLGPNSPEQAQAALGPVLDAIRQTTDPDQLQALAQAVQTLGPTPEQAQAALGPVLDAIRQTTDPDQLQALAQAVQTLGPKLARAGPGRPRPGPRRHPPDHRSRPAPGPGPGRPDPRAQARPRWTHRP